MNVPVPRRGGRGARMRGRGRAGFTLIEMLAVVALVSIVFTFAVRSYYQMSERSIAAGEATRSRRRAAAILDRVALDLAAATLLAKPPERDPLDHPWLFLAEGVDDDTGADRLKFVTRGRAARGSDAQVGEIEVVAYRVEEHEDGTRSLLRHAQPNLPARLDRSFPAADAEGSHLLADGLAGFGVKLRAEAGDWKSRWDSSTLVDSGELPLAAEIRVALAPESLPADPALVEPGRPERWYTRRIVLFARPLDLEALLASGAAGDGADDPDRPCGDGPTADECADAIDAALDGLSPTARDAVEATLEDLPPDFCAADLAGGILENLDLRLCE